MMKKLLAQFFCGMVGREAKLDIVRPHISVDVTIAMHAQFRGVKSLEEKIAWLQKDFSEQVRRFQSEASADMTESNRVLIADLAAKTPKKGEDANWSEELRVAVWKHRNRTANRLVHELQNQVVSLIDHIEGKRYDEAEAQADANGDTEVFVAEDPAVRTEALTGVAQVLVKIAEARGSEEGDDTVVVAPEAPASDDTVAVIDLVADSGAPAPEVIEIIAPEVLVQEVAPIAELPVEVEAPAQTAAPEPLESAAA